MKRKKDNISAVSTGYEFKKIPNREGCVIFVTYNLLNLQTLGKIQEAAAILLASAHCKAVIDSSPANKRMAFIIER